ncbi:MAG: RluA family pseudouridine synthase [Patescibacteria group bacterium]|nr:RluA family pseudouridine synthase [Patescibacteria group bacterium]
MIHKFTVPEEQPKTRLDVFLSEQLPELTRSAIANKLKNEAGLVNKKPAAVHTFIKPGDSITFNSDQPKKASKTKQMSHTGKVERATWDLKKMIVEETDDFIVINKPSGLIVHPDANYTDGTLVDLLVEYCPSIAKIGEDPSRPGIVHRIDKDVSGLMVIAKNQDTFDILKQQFKDRKTHKKYLALAYGTLPQKEGEIKFRIARSTSKARMAARPENEEKGKAAWTHYKLLEQLNGASLVELEIVSGRTHQIRAHLNALKNPVIGDPLYIQKQYKQIPTTRLMLQSTELSFLDPKTQERLTFNIPTAPAFNELIKKLKKESLKSTKY